MYITLKKGFIITIRCFSQSEIVLGILIAKYIDYLISLRTITKEKQFMKKGTIFSISISLKMGMVKNEVQEALVTENGIDNDGSVDQWGRKWGRQISCLNLSSVVNFCKENNLEIKPGTFGENILVDVIDLCELNLGDQIKLGKDVVLEVTQIGRENTFSNVPHKINLLSYEGVFCKVVKGGKILKGDSVKLLYKKIGVVLDNNQRKYYI